MDKPKKEIATRFWTVLVLASYLVLTYSSHVFMLSGLVGMFCIIFLGTKAWPESWLFRLGLKINTRSALISIICLPFIIAGSHLLVLNISLNQNITYISWLSDFSSIKYLQNFAQTFNEEMILGALLLNSIRKSFTKTHQIIISLWVALLFAILHYLFYSWVVVLPAHSGKLNLSALLTLFLVGVLRNTLILKTGHIAYAWALHFGFNLAFLKGSFFDLQRNIYLNQPESFNLILGSPMMVAVGFLMFLFSLFLYRNEIKLSKKNL